LSLDEANFLDICSLVNALTFHEKIITFPTNLPSEISDSTLYRYLRENNILHEETISGYELTREEKFDIVDLIGGIDNGKIAPCISDDGSVAYYCDDPRSVQAGGGGGCIPSPKEWANFLPSCTSVAYKESCSKNGQAMFTCEDPEFNSYKFPQGCIDTSNANTIVVPNEVPNNNNHKSKLQKCNGGENAPPCILGDNSIGYSCKDPRHFQSDGNQCLFWDKKQNAWGLKIDLPDYNGDKINNYNNMTVDDNNNDNHPKKKIDNSNDYICDSDRHTTAPSCDDFDNNRNYKLDKHNNNDSEFTFKATMLAN